MPVFSTAYIVTLVLTAVSSSFLIWMARHHPGDWMRWAERSLAVILLAVSIAWIVTTTTAAPWSWAYSLPLPLCDVATLVAVAGLWWKRPIWVELTYFWGLAGTLQALLTPDVNVGFPSLEFLEYVVAHAGIVVAALFLVVGERIAPRPKAAVKVYLITLAYTAVVGGVDALSGGDYMFLRHPPSAVTMLSVLGPWPWYIASAAGVAIVLLTALDAPFWRARRRSANSDDSGRSHSMSSPLNVSLPH